MDKLKMHSVNKVDENIEKIGALFPNVLTEVIKGYKEDGSAIVELAIDFDVLRQELSSVVVEGPEERYQFTWPDKKNLFCWPMPLLPKPCVPAGRKAWILTALKIFILKAIIWTLLSSYRKPIWAK